MEMDDSSLLIPLVFVFLLNGFLYSIYRWKKSDPLRHSLKLLRELFSICQFKLRRKRRRSATIESNELKYCYWILNKVSRSFAMVIEELPRSIGDVVCVFYLVLRGLDTVEDDMSLPKEEKKVLLKDFSRVLSSDHWSRDDLGENEFYRNLLKNFPRVTKTFRSFEEKYRRIIVETTERMAAGMIEFIDKDYSIDDLNDYNAYCHYVAGLVGEGLSAIFVASQLEKATLLVDQRLSNSMGLFLQKTNIIRDFHEDFAEGRIWWPRSIWSIYVDDLQQLIDDPANDKSRQCLNHLIVDCLEHLPDVLNYLRRLENAEIFQFCSIPQLMALATLDQLFDNPRVFTSKVKIRKGLTCQLILNSSSFPQILPSIRLFWQNIQKKISRNTNSFDRTAEEKFCRLSAAIEILHQK